MKDQDKEDLALIAAEIQEYVDQEIDPGWDLMEVWAERIRNSIRD